MSPAGSIRNFDQIIEMPKKARDNYIPIPDEQIDEVRRMSRKERRQWYRDNKVKWPGC